MPRQKRRRVPKLTHTTYRKIGWHVSYADPVTGVPKKKIFGNIPDAEAQVIYHQWVADHLRNKGASVQAPRLTSPVSGKTQASVIVAGAKATNTISAKSPGVISGAGLAGCLKEVMSGFLIEAERRIRKLGDPRVRGTIDVDTYAQRKKHAIDFGEFLNRRGKATAGMLLKDLTMADVEEFNWWLCESKSVGGLGFTSSNVKKAMQVVKQIIDQAGRPEFGQQRLTWNWDSRRRYYGSLPKPRLLPTVDQLKKILAACDEQHTAMVWLAIGCGFGQGDLSVMKRNCIDKKSYDLSRAKTGLDRSGNTPSRVWKELTFFLRKHPRRPDDHLFVTERGETLVHGHTDSVCLWWTKLRKAIGETKDTLSGFYILRHLGATELGSRPGMDSGRIKAWLGHSAGSGLVDRYQKPLSPKNKPIVAWVRRELRKS